MKDIVLAKSAGFCYGVKRAVEETLKARGNFNKPIFTLGQLIHNNDVVNLLRNKDINPISIDEINDLPKNSVVVIRSHGISLEEYNRLREQGLTIIDATCPYVKSIHNKVNKYYSLGYKIIIIGDKNHPEVIGINGWCDNSALITKYGDELMEVPNKVCVVSQTTEKQENWVNVLNILTRECKELVAFNTICNATEIRQKSADALSKKVDVMIVLGGKHSSNTTKLYEICKNNCNYTYHVENSGEIPENIINNKKIIGVTAGASTPDWIIKEAIEKMDKINENKDLEVNEQLLFMEENDNKIFVGATVTGSIISISDNVAYLNIGYKADGLLPLSEVTKDQNVKMSDLFKEGQEVTVRVIRIKNEDGYVVLSLIELEREKAFKTIKKTFEEKEKITVLVKEAVNGGLVTVYKGIRIFVPASHVELYHVENLNEYENKKFDINIIEFSQGKKGTRIVGSRRDILKGEKQTQIDNTWNLLEKDTAVKGVVRRLTDFGAFVEINGVDGLLHVSEISWGRVNKPKDVLTVDEEVNVYILDVDKENRKLSLSMKRLTEEPWEKVDEKYPVGSVVLGKVVRFADFGAFIELESGVDGLVHISQISHKRINKPGDVLKIGDLVKAKIIEVNKEHRKVALSIKEVDEIE